VGLVLGSIIVGIEMKQKGAEAMNPSQAGDDLTWLPLIWIVLYGCALHAAGFFTPRGLRVFGWAFVLGGCSAFVFWVLIGFHTLARSERVTC
jgi:hypothetical protein